MGKKKSLRSKAVHFVTDLTTGLLNPISDKPSKPPHPPPVSLSLSPFAALSVYIVSWKRLFFSPFFPLEGLNVYDDGDDDDDDALF